MVKEFKEKIITVNLRRVFDKPVTKRAKSALFVIKEAVRKETRAENIKISNLVNETVWEKGLFKAPRKITIKVVSGKEGVNIYLPDEKIKVKEEKKAKGEPKGLKEKAEAAVAATKGNKKEKTGVAEIAKEVEEAPGKTVEENLKVDKNPEAEKKKENEDTSNKDDDSSNDNEKEEKK